MKHEFIIVQKDEDGVFVYGCTRSGLTGLLEDKKDYYVVTKDELANECSLIDGDYGNKVLVVIKHGIIVKYDAFDQIQQGE
jgi:hypothetical protein